MSNGILSISFSVCTLFFLTFPAVLVFDAQRENVLIDFQVIHCFHFKISHFEQTQE